MSCDLIAALDVVRVTRLDVCGAPVAGENAFVTDCQASLAMNPNIETADDIIYRSSNGKLCGVKRGCPSLLGYDVEFNFYQVSPQLVDVLTNQPVVVDSAGEPVGNDDCDIVCDGGFALEFWTQLIGQNCTDTGAPRYLYGIIPWVSNAYLSDLELGGEAVTFQLIGASRAGGRWGVGPYDVTLNGPAPGTPGPMLTPLGASCHRRMFITNVAPPVPDPDCDYATVPPPAEPPEGFAARTASGSKAKDKVLASA